MQTPQTTTNHSLLGREIEIFHFKDFEVKAIINEQGEPWFLTKAVCEAVGISNVGQALSRLDEDEKSSIIIKDGTDGNPNHSIISESGLFSLVLSSRKPEAKEFKRWITHEVLPQIRKTGSYVKGKEITMLDYMEANVKFMRQQEEILNTQGTRITTVEDSVSKIKKDVASLQAKTTNIAVDFYTVAGFSRLEGIDFSPRVLNMVGRWASTLSRQTGALISKVPDARYGHINSYHKDILSQVFYKLYREMEFGKYLDL